MIPTINLQQKFDLVEEYWQPRIAGELNNAYLKLAKLKGEFIWHQHQNEDELFLVIKGSLKILLKDGTILLGEGELAIIPRGVQHKPVALEETWVLLIEPQTTRNTGNIQDEHTVDDLWI